MSEPTFVHLSVRSEYSMVDSIIRIKSLIKAAKSDAQPAVAITDYHNLFAVVKFYKAALSLGIKPIIGADLYEYDSVKDAAFKLTCLCQNEKGYKNLTRLISRAYLEGQRDTKPYIKREWLTFQSLEGLILLSGATLGSIAHLMSQEESLQDELSFWQKVAPGRFYLELTRVGLAEEVAYNQAALAISEAHDLPVVATNAVRFIQREEFMAHEARVCIHKGHMLSDPNRSRDYTKEQFFKSQIEMQHVFEDIPEALANTVQIAKRCNAHLKLGEVYLPDFPIPAGISLENYFAQKSHAGLMARFPKGFENDAMRERYEMRLKIELDVISRMGFAGYFLIVADFIQWAKDNAIPVGPGRGSGAGSIVAWSLKITDLDPLRYNLLFERFLNPERVSMPDFDIDFCMERRDEVIHYVAQKYGRECVSQIITYGTMAAKAVIRDVGRVLGHPYGFVDKIAKLIPFEIGMTLDKALEQEPELKRRTEDEEEVKALFDLALKLEGLTRNAGKHAGGVIMAPSALTDFAPLYCEPGGKHLVTQFDKDDIEQVGLVKFDFLGLRTLTIIDWACQNVLALVGERVDITSIALDDAKTFDLLKACHTTAVFQLESRGMKELIGRLQPDCFEDIIALVALFRPGPLQSGMVDDFINRKKGLAEIVYLHPEVGPILQPTYGVILYQEQVMQIAQVLAGYSLGAADLLRRAMGKKKPEEMAKQRDIFLQGAIARNVDEKIAGSIFDLMEKFAGYGFNKSHSAAYALIAYQTAWLKAHYPACFMAAVLSADMDNTDKVVYFREDAQMAGLTVLPPNINQSEYAFLVMDENTIVSGLGAIKGVGESAIQLIVNERKQGGPYKHFFDFFMRVDLSKINKRTLESLVYAGAFDTFGLHRAMLLANIELGIQQAQKQRESQAWGQGDLFSSGQDDDTYVLHDVPEMSLLNKLKYEKQTLGYYLSGHPYAYYATELRTVISRSLAELPLDSQVMCAGLVLGVRMLTTKRGKRMGILSIDDGTAKRDVTLFQEILDDARPLLIKDELVIIKAETSRDDYTQSVRLTAQAVFSLDTFRQNALKKLSLTICGDERIDERVKSLKTLFSLIPKGSVRVGIRYLGDVHGCEFSLANGGSISVDSDVLSQLESILGADKVKYIYE